MSTDRPPERVDPDSVARAGFETARRGFDQMQVRSYLTEVAREIERLRTSEADLTRRLEEAERHATEQSRTDPEHLTQLLGEETARVLNAAREAAAERIAHADEEATRLRQEAADESARTSASAPSGLCAASNSTGPSGRSMRSSRPGHLVSSIARLVFDSSQPSARATANAIMALSR